MGLFSDLHTASIEQNSIRIEARNIIFANEYSLIVNGNKQDQILGFLGRLYLHGEIQIEGSRRELTVEIDQRPFSTTYRILDQQDTLTPAKVF